MGHHVAENSLSKPKLGILTPDTPIPETLQIDVQIHMCHQNIKPLIPEILTPEIQLPETVLPEMSIPEIARQALSRLRRLIKGLIHAAL